MANQIIINNISGNDPFTIYLCDSTYSSCTPVATINSNQLPYTIFPLPSPYDTATVLYIKVVDDDGCIKFDVYYVPSPTPSPTPIGPTPTPTTTPTPTPSISPTPTNTVTPTPSGTGPTPTLTPTPSATGPTPTTTPPPTSSPTPTPSPTICIGCTPTPTPTPSGTGPTPTPSGTGPTPTPTPSSTRIIPTPTPTPSGTGPTPTPTPTLPSDCDTLLLLANGDVIKYNTPTNTYVTLFNSVGGLDIAHTQSKLWINSNTLIVEYNITLNPFSYNPSMRSIITLPVHTGAGLCVLPGATNKLVTTDTNRSPNVVVELDVTNNNATYTDILTLPPTANVPGDLLVTNTTPKKLLIILAGIGINDLYQYDYSTGNLEAIIPLGPAAGAWGLYDYNGTIYLTLNNNSVYSVLVNPPYTVTYVQNVNSGSDINGASQLVECYVTTFNQATPTPTYTPIPTSTLTLTPTITPSPTPSPTPTPTPSETRIPPTPSPSLTMTVTPSPTPSSTPPPTPPPTSTIIPTSSPTPTLTLTPTVTLTPSPTPPPTSTIIPTPPPTPSPTLTLTPTPSVTLTPTPTPTVTLTPTPSPTLTCNCYKVVNPFNIQQDLYYTDCNNIRTGVTFSGNQISYICANRINFEASGNVDITIDSVCIQTSPNVYTCDRPTPTPTITLTPTPSPSLSPSPTPTPTLPCAIYSFQGNRGFPSPTYQYKNCSGQIVTESFGLLPQERCVDRSYPITLISGVGTYTYVRDSICDSRISYCYYIVNASGISITYDNSLGQTTTEIMTSNNQIICAKDSSLVLPVGVFGYTTGQECNNSFNCTIIEPTPTPIPPTPPPTPTPTPVCNCYVFDAGDVILPPDYVCYVSYDKCGIGPVRESVNQDSRICAKPGSVDILNDCAFNPIGPLGPCTTKLDCSDCQCYLVSAALNLFPTYPTITYYDCRLDKIETISVDRDTYLCVKSGIISVSDDRLTIIPLNTNCTTNFGCQPDITLAPDPTPTPTPTPTLGPTPDGFYLIIGYQILSSAPDIRLPNYPFYYGNTLYYPTTITTNINSGLVTTEPTIFMYKGFPYSNKYETVQNVNSPWSSLPNEFNLNINYWIGGYVNSNFRLTIYKNGTQIKTQVFSAVNNTQYVGFGTINITLGTSSLQNGDKIDFYFGSV